MAISSWKKILYCLAIILSAIYLIWRIGWTIPWEQRFWVLLYAIVLWVCEVISNLTAYITIIFRMLPPKKKMQMDLHHVLDTWQVPDVDVLIATHNEDRKLLEKTVNGATYMNYPKDKLHIYICDDGNRSEIKGLADQYGVGYIGLENNHEAKSGNLNHALSLLTSPLFVDFDSDMIPYTNFLQETVPYFQQNWLDYKNDPDNTQPLGYVQTPQSFYENDIFQYNLFSERIVANEQDFFSRDVNVLYGQHGYTIFTGSNALFLRQAVDKVGGFPTKTLTEDFELGARVNIAGYSSFSTTEPQSAGTTPLDLKGVIKQRSRWGRGVIQSCRNLHIFLNSKIAWTHKVILANAYFYWWSFFRRLIYIAAPILFAVWKIQVVDTNFWLLLLMWAPGYALLHTVLGDSSSRIRNERWGEVQETFFAPYLFLPVILQTMHIKKHSFQVTQKSYQRNWLDRVYLLPHLAMWLLTTYAIIKFNYGKWGSEILYGAVITFWLLMHWINLSFAVFIAMGRQVFRQQTRFPRKIAGTIKGAGEMETIDISDTGLSFQLRDKNAPVLSAGEKLAGKLHLSDDLIKERNFQSPDQTLDFDLTIVRKIDDQDRYAATVTPADSSLPGWLHLVYDQHNQAVPEEYDRWMTPFDILGMNARKRLEKIEWHLRRRFTRQREG
ncbi:glycosyltransferase family 2 protein [uncultured Lactobacillus sp.]|uniref:glycosyltransferase family 2 protein n=1 Tax=uncultured Lactobacillus sp. TaxID=153152 RepID=UPI0025921EE5|nr:glycosyltransferase family 2 protein [uncultured Lactobacillus sp.]